MAAELEPSDMEISGEFEFLGKCGHQLVGICSISRFLRSPRPGGYCSECDRFRWLDKVVRHPVGGGA